VDSKGKKKKSKERSGSSRRDKSSSTAAKLKSIMKAKNAPLTSQRLARSYTIGDVGTFPSFFHHCTRTSLRPHAPPHAHHRTRTTARNTHGCMFQCMLETSHGRGLNDIHLWTVDGHEKYVVNRQVRGVLERVDEFEETDYEDSGDDDDNGGNDQAASAGGHEDVDPKLQDLFTSTSSMSA
jgi:hypothetical protein